MSVYLGEQLKKLRKAKGMTQADLGFEMGLGKSAIGMYERGEREPDYEILERLADYFNVPMAILVDKKTLQHKTQPIITDGLSDAHIGFISGFYKIPKAHRDVILAVAETLLKGAAQHPAPPEEEV